MAFEARGFPRRPAIVRESTAHGRTVTPDDGGCRVVPPFETPFDGAHPTDPLLEFLLRMPVRLVEGFRSFMQVMEVTEWVRHLGSSTGHGTANREVPIGDHPCNGHL